jgi:hypothetical protein
MDLRCDNSILFGRISEGVLETKCKSSRCGAGPGTVVIHRFSLVTGRMIGTNRYKDPIRSPKG